MPSVPEDPTTKVPTPSPGITTVEMIATTKTPTKITAKIGMTRTASGILSL